MVPRFRETQRAGGEEEAAAGEGKSGWAEAEGGRVAPNTKEKAGSEGTTKETATVIQTEAGGGGARAVYLVGHQYLMYHLPSQWDLAGSLALIRSRSSNAAAAGGELL